MRQLVIGVLATTLATGLVFAQGQTDRAALDKKIMEMEQQIHEAYAKQDEGTFRKMVAADGAGIDPAGGVVKMGDYVAMMKATTVEPGWKLDNHRVMWINDNAAVHIYRWTGKSTHEGKPVPSPVWMSTVWAMRDGRWVPVFHQETPAMTPSTR